MSSTPSLSLERGDESLRGLIAQRAARWARRRQGADPNPVSLASGRIYILPTGVGITYALMVFGMLLGSMNYNNSMGFALTFFLAALGLVGMHHCHRNLAGLVVAFSGADPVFAGDEVRLRFTFTNESTRSRFDLCAQAGGVSSNRVDLEAGGSAIVAVRCKTRRRGYTQLGRYGVRTTHPLSLFRAWAWIHVDAGFLVWPRPADGAPAPPPAEVIHGRRANLGQGEDDFAGLRDFHDGDPPRHVAWKTYARSQELKSKRFAGSDISLAWFDLDDVPGTHIEARLSILARWIIAAEKARRPYGLRLGELRIEPSRGEAHRKRCLDALARYGHEAHGTQ